MHIDKFFKWMVIILLILVTNYFFYEKPIYGLIIIGILLFSSFFLIRTTYQIFCIIMVFPFIPPSGIEIIDEMRSLIIVAIIGLLFIKIIYDQLNLSGIKIPQDIEFLFLYFYIIWMILSMVWAPKLDYTFYWIKANVSLFFLFLIILMSKIDKRIIKYSIIGYFLISILASLYGIIQYLISFAGPTYIFGQQLVFRVNSIFYDPNIFARFSSITYVFALVFSFNILKKRRLKIYKILIILILLLSPISILLSQSRSGLIIFLLSNIIVLLYFKKYKILAFGMACIFLFIYFINPSSSNIFERLTLSNALLDYSIVDRYLMLKGSVKMSVDYFFKGVGIGNFAYIYHYYRPINIPFPLSSGVSHNWFFSVLVELGIVGVILFVSFLIKSLSMIYKSIPNINKYFYRNIQFSIFVNLLMIIVFGLFYGSFFHHYEFWILLGFGYKINELFKIYSNHSTKKIS